MHAYLYDIDDPVEKPIILKFVDGDVTKYAVPTDYGYRYCSKEGVMMPTRNPTKGKPVKPVYYLEQAESSSGQFTNNYAEMKGLYNALGVVLLHGVKQVHIQSDSEYALNGLQKWCADWERRNWYTSTGSVVSNLELWQALWTRFKIVTQEKKIAFSAQWVKGHFGHPGNVHADMLATVGVFKSQQGIDDGTIHYFPTKKFWEVDRDRHPLLSLKRLYFDRCAEQNLPGHYLMADPGKDDALFGKRLPEAVYAIVQMKEPHPIIDTVWKRQARIRQDENQTMMMRMETLFSHDIYRHIQTHGEFCLQKGKNASTNVEFLDNRPVTLERKLGLTMRAIDCFDFLEKRFDEFQQLMEDKEAFALVNHQGLNAIDITDEFYDLKDKKVGKEVTQVKVLKKEFVVGSTAHGVTREIEFPDKTRTITFPLAMGLDLPDRNSMKQLENDNPVVYLITWRDSSLSLRFATVLACESATAIWSNFYADRLIIKP